MKTVKVSLSHHEYPIYIGENLLKDPSIIQTHIAHEQAMIVSNTTVADIYLDDVKTVTQSHNTSVCLLKDGEQYKTLDTTLEIFNDLMSDRHRRNTTLIALGGGVIGDITGFAAHCYQRGVPFIQIPTTLLAQVDASIGGKTGVNHPLGKNMIGAFHQPQCVVIDTSTLNTLPEREYRAGLAEVVKHALILDADGFNWLESRVDAIMAKDPAVLIDMIERSCQIKANVVMQDEKEQLGIRQLLNLGHTFGHAIETATNYKTYLHGEAVAIGMVMAAKLSMQLGYLQENDVNRIISLLETIGLPTTLISEIELAKLVELMHHDKKNQSDKLRLVILNAIGKAEFKKDFSADLVLEALK